jgi:hypothetical protein
VAAGTPLHAASAPEQEPLRLAAGSLARDRLVAVGRDLEVHGRALSDVTVLDGSLTVSGEVGGAVLVLGGDVRLAGTARVAGDLYVAGGRLVTEPGAEVGGRAVAWASASRAWLTLLEGPSLGLPATSPVVLAAKLALAAAWLLLSLLLFATAGRAVLATSEEIRRAPLRCLATGVVGVFALLLTALLVSAVARSLALPLLVLVVIVALLFKLWGMVALFHAVGAWLATFRPYRRRLALHVALAGFLLLTLLKLVPYLGTWLWTMASFVAVGASIGSKLGRREPWFADDPATLFALPPGRS